jgi:hypothetical protein
LMVLATQLTAVLQAGSQVTCQVSWTSTHVLACSPDHIQHY